MNIVITGATGLIGGAVARALKAQGHGILALSRSEGAADKARAQGFDILPGDLEDTALLRAATLEADAVIHAASPHDHKAAELDRRAIHVLLEALRGTGKRLIYTSGCLVYGETGDRAATEETPCKPLPMVAWREILEREIRAAQDVHAVIIRPGWVYGHGGGTAMMMLAQAQNEGAARVIGTGDNRWSCVHAEDLARLYALALTHAPAGSVYNGVNDGPVSLIEIARAASRAGGAQGRVTLWPLEAARQTLHGFADAIACDQVVSGAKAQVELGWRPVMRTILQEFEMTAWSDRDDA
ncbi:NAD-dependent epimerase/dehydratase family protein [Asaia krungthepensis]|uniref:Nucleoside-diphosphate-sugar epimerase n=1 Tax=Asaia krungthepensis NRIC 0535 TaxID=1307925 RepID=A0ABQ0Q3D2_9PROT|nr:NAD-dependent epimerase/dehydratase family protein [Asaia krungthepensis]GBQ89427.1 nucleoside-diphosphate-sugar epimerase [Asaia krungthepensis NRIC 0535]